MAEAGKGSRPRPISVDQETFDANWQMIFCKKNVSENDNKFSDKEIIDHSGEDQ